MDTQNQFHEKDIEKSFDLKLFIRLLRYAKPYTLLLTLCILLLLVVTVVDVLNPFLIKIAIDDIVNPEEQIIGIYNTHKDPTGFTHEDRFYTAITHRYLAPDKSYRLFINEGKAYFTDMDFVRPTTFTIEPGRYATYLNGEGKNYRLYPIEDDLYQKLKGQRAINLTQLSLFFAMLLVMGFIFNYGQVYLLNWTSQKIIYHMREDLFKHLLHLDLEFYEKNPVGRLVTRITNDLDNINEMYTSVLLTVLKDALMLISIVVIMFVIDARLAMVSLITFPLVVIATWIFRIKIRAVQRRIKLQIAIINAKLSEYISGMSIIQIFGVEKNYYDDFQKTNDDYKDSLLDEIKIFGIFRPAVSYIYALGLVLLMFYGSLQVQSHALEIGVLVAFTRYIKQFYQPIFDFSEKFNIMQSAMASAERLFVLQETVNRVPEPETPKRVKKLRGEIEFKRVTFGYDKDQPVLKDISFKVLPGETIALVGHTGSGKTTITNLINRFYDVQSGQILIDGIDVREIETSRLRSHIGMVLQDVYLFSASLSDNIRLFNPAIPQQRVEEAANVVNAAGFIDNLPGRYDYILKERGNEFSTGQRQLLSFARAMAYNPEIMILDEATSNIDTETELLIQDAIQKLSQRRTTIIIAHRLSTIKHADKIIVLNKGEIKEVGNHESLIQKGGLYYSLYKLQYAQNSEEETA